MRRMRASHAPGEGGRGASVSRLERCAAGTGAGAVPCSVLLCLAGPPALPLPCPASAAARNCRPDDACWMVGWVVESRKRSADCVLAFRQSLWQSPWQGLWRSEDGGRGPSAHFYRNPGMHRATALPRRASSGSAALNKSQTQFVGHKILDFPQKSGVKGSGKRTESTHIHRQNGRPCAHL